MNRAAIYVRVSTQEQVNGFSVSEQKDRLINYCKAKDWLVAGVYVDPGYSGANLDRPAVQELIRNIKKYDTVLVYKLDRLSRSQRDTMYLIEQVFLPASVDFVSMQESFDTSSPFGRAMVGILSVFAQLERDQIRERTQMGAYARAKMGMYHGSAYQPIGYKRGDDGHYAVLEYEAIQVRKVFQLYADGFGGLAKVAEELTRLGYSHKYGGWTSSNVRNVIINRVYLGEIHYRDVVVEGAHEPLVSRELFERANKVLQVTPQAFNRHSASLCQGFIFCGKCGARLGTRASRPHRYYVCYSSNGCPPDMVTDPSCDAHWYRCALIDSMVDYAVRSLVFDEDKLHELICRETSSGHSFDGESEVLRAELKKIDVQLDRLMDLYQDARIPASVVAGRVDELYARRQSVEAQLSALAPSVPPSFDAEVLSSAADIWGLASVEQKRYLLQHMLDRIVVYEDRIVIFWSFAPNSPETFMM